MTENERNTNRLDAVGYEAITEATIFDSTSRQTARMVVPLSFTEDFESEKDYRTNVVEESEKDYRTNVMPRTEDDLLKTDASYAHRNEARLEPLIASEPKRKSFWRYFTLMFLVIFMLGAGAAGGFALAQYQRQKEEKGIAVLPLPAVKNGKGLPELIIEPSSNEVAQAETEETEEKTEPEQTKEQEETQTNTAPSRTPENSSTEKEKSPDTRQNTNNDQSSAGEGERKVAQPKRPAASNSNQQKQTQQKSKSTADTAREQLKKIGRRIKDIFSGN